MRAKRQSEEMTAFDSVCFAPILSMAKEVYQERNLETKLSDLRGKFDFERPLVQASSGASQAVSWEK